MSRSRVYIATTEGPVKIQRLEEEDPVVRSVICLNGTSEALPISSGYDAFVRRPTGVIERLFGHPAYRMDLSRRIGAGRSWQLGVLATHALKAEGQLAGKEEPPGHILWITGEVDSTLNVRPVSRLPEKLRQSAALFESALPGGQRLTLIVPAGNLEAARDGNPPEGAELIGVETADDLFSALGLRPAGNSGTAGGHLHRFLKFAGGVAAVAALTATGLLFQNSEPPPPPDRNPDPAPTRPSAATLTPKAPELTLFELRAPPGSNCAAVRFGKVSPEPVELHPDASGNYHSTHLERFCGLVFRLHGENGNAPLRLQARFIEGDGYFENSALFSLSSQPQPGPEASWRVIFPRRFRKGFRYEIETATTPGAQETILHSGN